MNPIVAILAGGRSQRMGLAKATVQLAGRSLVSYPLAAARAGGLEAWVVAKEGSELPPLDCRVLIEPAEPQHPLCGVVTALRAAAPAPVVAVATDMPFVGAELLAWLAAQPATTAVEADGRLQPLLARYSADALEPLELALAARRSLTAALSSLGPKLVAESDLRRFGDPDRICFNVNTREDLSRAEALLDPDRQP